MIDLELVLKQEAALVNRERTRGFSVGFPGAWGQAPLDVVTAD